MRRDRELRCIEECAGERVAKPSWTIVAVKGEVRLLVGATRRLILRLAATQNEKPTNLDWVARVTLLLLSLTRSLSLPKSLRSDAIPRSPARSDAHTH